MQVYLSHDPICRNEQPNEIDKQMSTLVLACTFIRALNYTSKQNPTLSSLCISQYTQMQNSGAIRVEIQFGFGFYTNTNTSTSIRQCWCVQWSIWVYVCGLSCSFTSDIDWVPYVCICLSTYVQTCKTYAKTWRCYLSMSRKNYNFVLSVLHNDCLSK